MAYPRRDIAKTCGTLAVTTSSQVLIPNNPSRLSLRITTEDGTNATWAKFATTVGGSPVATANSGAFKITPTSPLYLTEYTGPVALIALAGTSVNILEI